MAEQIPVNSLSALSREDLKPGAIALLSPEINFVEITAALTSYRSMLCSVSELAADSQAVREHLFFENGKAIGTFWAAKCLDEPLRTKRFATGLYKAVLDLQKKITNRPVRVLYAGTGPFATLMLPVVAMLEPSQVQFSLLEINPATFAHLQKTISGLNLGAYVAAMELTDATTYRIAPGQLPDIIVSETMQHALTREMQVPVIFNLAAQAPEAILIPQQIRLELGWLNSGNLASRFTGDQTGTSFYRKLGEFFKIDRPVVNEFATAFPEGMKQFSFPEQIFNFRAGHEQEELAFFTSIQVYEDEMLGLNQCSLTIPYKVSRLFRGIPREGRIRICYQVSTVPGPEIQIIES